MNPKYYFPPVHFWTLWFSEAMRYYAEKNGAEINKNTVVLDVGCGLGYHCFTLSNIGLVNVSGVDISDETINLLNEFGHKPKFFKFDICKDDISKYVNYFNLIFSSDVYEHVEDPQVMLNNLFAMLDPKGAICITFPNWVNHGQNQFTDKSQLHKRLKEAGFSKINIEIIDNYSFLYRIFMNFYKIAQKISDIIFSVKRKEFKGSGMPESDEFQGMYAYSKIQKLKKHKFICEFLNINYSLLKNLLRLTPPYRTSDSEDVMEKRIIVFAQK